MPNEVLEPSTALQPTQRATGLVDPFGNDLLTEVTSGYQPSPVGVWGWGLRDLPRFDYYKVNWMLLDQTIQLGLAMRMAPIVSAEFAYKEGKEWIEGVQADKPEVGAFVKDQLTRLWRNDIHQVLTNQIWGWSAGEIMYRVVDDQIEFDRLESRHAEDVRPLMYEGQVVGVQVSGNFGNKSGTESQVTSPVKLGLKSKAYWAPFLPENGSRFGWSILKGPYSSWCDKWLDGGALDVRRLAMHADAYGGENMYYPPGKTNIDGKGEIPNRDIALQIVERKKSGSVGVLPSIFKDGKRLWEMEDVKTNRNFSHILEYPKDLDVEMLRGMEIADEVIMSSQDSSGAWAGRKVPLLAFYNGLYRWGNQTLSVIVRDVMEPLVLWRFGKAENFQATLKPFDQQLIEKGQPDQGQQNQGQGQGFGAGGFGDGVNGTEGGFGGGGFGGEEAGGAGGFLSLDRSQDGVRPAREVIRLSTTPDGMPDEVDAVGAGQVSAEEVASRAAQAVVESQRREIKPAHANQAHVLAELPPDIAAKCLDFHAMIDAEDMGRGLEYEPHITVAAMLQGVTPGIVSHVLRETGPFAVRLTDTMVFEHEDKDVLVIEVQGEVIRDINRRILDTCPNEQTYPCFQPHVTLAYLKPGAGAKYAGMDHLHGASCVIDEVVFSPEIGQRTIIPLNEQVVRFSGDWQPFVTRSGTTGAVNAQGDKLYGDEAQRVLQAVTRQDTSAKGTAENVSEEDQKFEKLMGTKSPEDADAFRRARKDGIAIPPAWTDVTYYGADKDIRAEGRDSKGRKQRAENPEYRQRISDENNARIRKELTPRIGKLRKQLRKDAAAGDEESKVLYLISLTGFRIGGKGDGRAKVKAFGASTLQGEHVTVEGDAVTFDFPGKKGVRQQHTIADPVIADMMRDAKDGEPIFSTSDRKVRAAWKDNYGGTKVHDIRHVVATEIAERELERTIPPPPKNAKQRVKMIKKIASFAARKLGNNVSQIISTYADPTLWDKLVIAA